MKATTESTNKTTNKGLFQGIGIILLFVSFLISGCAHYNNAVEELTHKHNLHKQLVKTPNFSHWLYSKTVPGPAGNILHVYIEGDGVPWLRKDLIASDPSPKNPLALKLMVQDKSPSIYLGRPCYFGLVSSQNCDPPMWTHRRYSLEVVDSLQAALQLYLQQNPFEQITFIGYSGGGVLAMLLADRFPQTYQLVTIAANLDIDAWTQFHNFSTLSGSINPAKQPPLKASIKQLHLAGKRDKNVPVAIIRFVSLKQKNSSTQVFDKFDHICCWEDKWPFLLKHIK